MIRISGGKWGGRYIDSPKSQAIRPTTGRVRESLFSQIRDQLTDARFLDLFAGSGLMGIEALSRGAGYVLAVEKNPQHVRLLRQNYDKLGISSAEGIVMQQDILRLVETSPPEPFQIIFLDPPYRFKGFSEILAEIINNHWISPGGLIVAELGIRDQPLPGANIKTFGDTQLNFLTQPLSF